MFPCQLCKAYAVLWAARPFVGSETPKHNDFDQFWKFLNIFQETHDFLILTDSVIICIYLKTTERHFRNQGNIRHPTSKLLKWDSAQTLDTFRNPSLQILLPGRHHWFNLFSYNFFWTELKECVWNKIEETTFADTDFFFLVLFSKKQSRFRQNSNPSEKMS